MPTILQTFLSRGYFPKELPPPFTSDSFAAYVTSTPGRAIPVNPIEQSRCVEHNLALVGKLRRTLSIPNPKHHLILAREVSKHSRRLLKRASASPFSCSKPVFSKNKSRSLWPSLAQDRLARKRALA